MSWRTSPLPRDWTQIVKRIRARDPLCVECVAIGRSTPTTDVHHIGDPDDHSDANLVGLCAWHHARHTSAQASAARAPRVRQRREPERHPGLT